MQSKVCTWTAGGAREQTARCPPYLWVTWWGDGKRHRRWHMGCAPHRQFTIKQLVGQPSPPAWGIQTGTCHKVSATDTYTTEQGCGRSPRGREEPDTLAVLTHTLVTDQQVHQHKPTAPQRHGGKTAHHPERTLLHTSKGNPPHPRRSPNQHTCPGGGWRGVPKQNTDCQWLATTACACRGGNPSPSLLQSVNAQLTGCWLLLRTAGQQECSKKKATCSCSAPGTLLRGLIGSHLG